MQQQGEALRGGSGPGLQTCSIHNLQNAVTFMSAQDYLGMNSQPGNRAARWRAFMIFSRNEDWLGTSRLRALRA